MTFTETDSKTTYYLKNTTWAFCKKILDKNFFFCLDYNFSTIKQLLVKKNKHAEHGRKKKTSQSQLT